MGKKVEQLEKEIEAQRASIEKSKNRIKELERKICQMKKEEELANNKMIADAVRVAYGEITEENINHFIHMLQESGTNVKRSIEKV